MNINLEGNDPSPPQQPKNTMGVAPQALPNGRPTMQQQPYNNSQTQQNQPQQNGRNKLLLTIASVALALLLVALIVVGVKSKLNGSNSKQVATTVAVESTDAAATTVPVELQEASQEELLQKVVELQKLNEELQKKVVSAEVAPPAVTGAPSGVTSVSEWTSEDPNILKSGGQRQYKEFVPYTKKFVQLPNGNYFFSALVSYGGQEYVLEVSYSDYMKLKPQGTIVVKIETASVNAGTPEAPTYKDTLVYISVDPEWERLTTIQ